MRAQPDALPILNAQEARGYLILQGLDPDLAEITQESPGIARWRVPRPDGTEQVFRFQPGAGRLLDDTDRHELSVRLVQAVPTRPELLGPAYLDVVLSHVQAAQEARRLLPPSPLDASLDALAQEMAAARHVVRPLPPEEWYLPQTRFLLPEGEHARIPAAPCPVDALRSLLAAGWSLVDDQLPDRPEMGVLRHPDGALLEVHVQGDQVLDWRLLEGSPALWAWIRSGWRLTPDVSRTLRLQLGPGRPLQEAMEAALQGLGTDVQGLIRLDAGNDRVHRYLLVEQRVPRRRSALLAVITTPDDRILGRHLLEGPAGFDQLTRVIRGAVAGPPDEDAIRRLVGQYAHTDDPDALTLSLLARPGDAARVFAPEVATGVERSILALRANPPRIRLAPEHTEIDVTIATAEELAAGVSAFPGAYQALARWFQPGTRWATWSVHAPGARGVRYDGMVRIDDRWAWFPKPWRLIEPS